MLDSDLQRVLSNIEWLGICPTHVVSRRSMTLSGSRHSFLKHSVTFLGFCSCSSGSSRLIRGDNRDRYLPVFSHTSSIHNNPPSGYTSDLVFLNSFLTIIKIGNTCRRQSKKDYVRYKICQVYSKFSTTILTCIGVESVFVMSFSWKAAEM